MPVYRLDDRLVFPPVHLAEDGLLALGGDLRPERLILGYTKGIFPWYAENLPILWHSPDPRMIMTTRDLVVQRSLKKAIRRKPYRITMDQAFPRVLEGCSTSPRPGQNGTWLIKRRDGTATSNVTPKTPNDAVKKPDDTGKSTNALEVRVGGDKVDFVINGAVVHSEPKSALAKTDGVYGIRVNHLLEVQIDGFGVSK